MISLIILCSLIGTVLLIGVCAPLSAATVPTPSPRIDSPQTVMEEPFREDRGADANSEYGVSGESTGENTVRDDLREWIVRSSIPTMRSRGMADEEIKAELLRDFSIKAEVLDELLKG